MKLADSLLAYCNKSSRRSEVKEINTVFTDRDISSVQYLGGYVLHNLRKKHVQKQSSESQQAMAILKAGKSEINTSQNLISSVAWVVHWSVRFIELKVDVQ